MPHALYDGLVSQWLSEPDRPAAAGARWRVRTGGVIGPVTDLTLSRW